jgi:putative ABC transport system ATP-binding protein
MQPVCRLADVIKRYGAQNTPVLDGVSLDVQTGEWVAITGASGSGKSSLLQLVGGLDRAYAGKVEVLGQDLGGLRDAELATLRSKSIGFVFQAFHLVEHLSVVENVALPALFSPDGVAVRARVDAALERVGIADKRDARPTALSGGQRQRVAIARALVTEPALLLADEPTGNLDEQTGEAILDLFDALVKEGRTLVVVTHEPRVWRRAGRTLQLAAGKLTARSTS